MVKEWGQSAKKEMKRDGRNGRGKGGRGTGSKEERGNTAKPQGKRERRMLINKKMNNESRRNEKYTKK